MKLLLQKYKLNVKNNSPPLATKRNFHFNTSHIHIITLKYKVTGKIWKKIVRPFGGDFKTLLNNIRN